MRLKMQIMLYLITTQHNAGWKSLNFNCWKKQWNLYLMEYFKTYNGALNYADNENAVSVSKIIKVDNVVAPNSRE